MESKAATQAQGFVISAGRGCEHAPILKSTDRGPSLRCLKCGKALLTVFNSRKATHMTERELKAAQRASK